MTHQLEITVLSGVSAGDVFRFSLEEGGALVIGRAPECDMVLQEQTVSRRHARIECRPDGFYISDFGSTHGTIHMGFRLPSGAEGARRLNDEDEFKVGSAIFRAGIKGAFAQTEEPKAIDQKQAAKLPTKKISARQKKLIALGAVAALLVLLLFTSSGGGGGLPKQTGHVALNFPQTKPLGYWPAKGKSRDLAHTDQVQFFIPGGDLVIEYDYRSDIPIKVLLDDIPVEMLDPNPSDWQHRIILIRDLVLGRERRLVFDNPDIKLAPGQKPEKEKLRPWAVRDARLAVVTDPSKESATDFVAHAAASLDAVDSIPEGLFNGIRSFQQAVIALLDEAKIDAVGYAINLEDRYPDLEELKAQMRILMEQRKGEVSPQVADNHRHDLVKIAAKFDSEMWRRFSKRTQEAEFLSGNKRYIEAYDLLTGLRRMIPEEGEFRTTVAARMLNDNKLIPKRIRENPDKYRRRDRDKD
jgi:hypothetical protein